MGLSSCTRCFRLRQCLLQNIFGCFMCLLLCRYARQLFELGEEVLLHSRAHVLDPSLVVSFLR